MLYKHRSAILYSRSRCACLACGLLLVLLTAPCVLGGLVWREWRQAKLNRDLIGAVEQADPAKTRALLLRGADANAVADEEREGRTEPGQWWSLSSYFRPSSQKKGSPALLSAVEDYHGTNYPHGYFGSLAIARLLVQYGASVNIRDKDETPLLCFAARNDAPEVVALLLEQGSSANVQDSEGNTPLFWAAGTNDARKLHLLLEKGADPNIANSSGETPLLEACSWDNMEIARALLDKGADMHVKNKEGKTALLLAKEADNPLLVKFLKDAGAKE